jgi:ABC-type branched-subunit amino acid transport system substrate-binding protein
MRIVLAALALVCLGACQSAPVRSRDVVNPPSAPVDTVAVVEETAPPPAAEPVERPAPTRGETRVGLLAPFSGRYAGYGQSFLAGARAALDASPTKPNIVLIPADSKGEAIGSLEATRRLILQEQVVCILGDVLNLTTMLAGVEANCRGVPMLSNVATEDDIGRIGPWVIHDVPSRRVEAEAAAELAMFTLRRDEAGILSSDAPASRDLAARFAERFGGLGGNVVTSEVYPEGTKDFNAWLVRVRDASPDVLYLPVSADDMQMIAPALSFQGVLARLIGSAAWNSERLLEASALDLEGALIPVHASDTAAPGQLPARLTSGDDTDRFALAGFTAAQRIRDLVAAHPAAAADREALRAALEKDMQSKRARSGIRFLVVRDGATRAFEAP